ncbi:apoptotic chromatin condensation inducer 1b isoform X2 [Nerophis ophidion]|uniref:apoptotic chromatin condensation inducer 1b isoform X2 n=1 Tax=Nerophis ophidion TaxID=159077 RepID=UPI002ADFF9FA|nr:apoptotic chromatin condensation inducer 1b isoform X2 [Nerophis ophidion]
MADEDITLDGQPLQSLRVADLKAALERRNLPKSGAKNKLIQRLKGALMLEDLQKSSSSHGGLQPNSQIGEEMSQNSFIKQYLAKQQELLCQKTEKEAERDDESPAVPEDEDQSDDDSSPCVFDMKHPLNRTEERVGGGSLMGEGMMMMNKEPPEAPGAKRQRASFPQGHKEPPVPSPPRAVASLSVRVVGQPDRQGLPPTVSRGQEKEGTAPRERGSAHSVLHLSRSAGIEAGDQVHKDSDEDDDSDSEDDEDWGPGPGGARKGSQAPPQPPQMPANAPSAAARSKRKLQPPQHIPPPQPDQNLMQLRHPTPPPSPPPDLFRLPDTPKQSPPDNDDKEGESSDAARGVLPAALQRQDSDSSSRSSSPEPLAKHGLGPLSMLVHKMESEEAGSATSAGTSQSQLQMKQEKMEIDSKHQIEDVKESRTNELDKEKQADGNPVTAPTKTQESSSSSDSDSQSDSSSSCSSSPARVQSRRVRQVKKADLKQEGNDETKGKGAEKEHLLKSEVSEPSLAAVSEAEPDSESPVSQQLMSEADQINSEGHLEESTTPKAFAARKISLTSSKMLPNTATDVGGGDADSVAVAGRKRRWGSSTAVTSKKPSISITTDSLKTLIPDIKVAHEAVVDLLLPEDLQMSGDEDNNDNSQGDQDKGLKIRRTVTQVVPADNQENGQEEVKEKESAIAEREIQQITPTDKPKKSVSDETCDKPDTEPKKVSPSDSLVRRSISQQRSGMSVTIDDPVRSTRQPSPPRGKLSNIIHVTNLVRPFTLDQLKELLKQTGSVMEEGFWIDKIKSHCYVTYATTEEAVATRAALHGVKWPQSNPKVLSVDFCEQDELDFHKGILKPKKEENHFPQLAPHQIRLPPLMPERDKETERDRDRGRDRDRDRDRDRGAPLVRDLLAERQREMERRERTRGEREWDRDKIREFAKPGEEERRSRSRDRERRRRERAKSKERRTEKKEKAEEAPAKLLDDLFLKTKAAPCIYWLPLTEEQAVQRLLERGERQKERERRLKEQKEEEEKKREEERKERLKTREKEGGGATMGTRSTGGRGGDTDRDKERGWNADGDRRREGDRRSGQPTTATEAGWRSRSRSDTRDRRR